MKSGSNLEKLLARGEFVVTAELGPPMGASLAAIEKKAEFLRGNVDAVNVTDNQTAVVRMSSVSVAAHAVKLGLEPIMQMTCRDRNRIAIQSDLLGAAAWGIKNCLCLAGDHQSFSRAGKLLGHPGAKNVYDLDSLHLVMTLKAMRDENRFIGGDPIEEGMPCRMFIGAAWTPLGEPISFRPLRLAKKSKAGADFVQTQGVYDMAAFAEQMKKVRNRGTHEQTAILVGIIVPKTAGMLKYMAKSVAGVTVPESMIKRFEGKKGPEAAAEGVKVTTELIQQAREIEGVRGVHIMAIEWEHKIPEIVQAAGLLPRPKCEA
jgi:methylenetetrahydrofolate reductase (NADPH)